VQGLAKAFVEARLSVPAVTDPIAQSQWITVAKNPGGARASSYTITRTPFEWTTPDGHRSG